MAAVPSASADGAAGSSSSGSLDLSKLPACTAKSVVIADKGLHSIPAGALLGRADSLKQLNLSENPLTSLESLSDVPFIETLVLDKTGLGEETLATCPRLEKLKTLSCNNNRISDIVEFCDIAVERFPALSFLSLMRNPASPNFVLLSEEDIAASQRYRLYVSFRLPALAFLDSSPVSPAEREEAKEKGRYLAPRKPKKKAEPGVAGGASPAAGSGADPSGGSVAAGDDDDAVSVAGQDEGDSGAGGGGDGGGGDSPASGAFLGLGRSRYDGSHSEGNRFIVDEDL